MNHNLLTAHTKKEAHKAREKKMLCMINHNKNRTLFSTL